MTNLSFYTSEAPSTAKAIFSQYKKLGEAEKLRCYLGASQIGHPCKRYLWYVFRHCCKAAFDGRMYRLFNTGVREEERLVNDLRSIGATVYNIDETTGKQFAVSAVGGHFSGHLDGCVAGIPEAPKTWHVLECKTHNSKSFGKLCEKGVKESKPQHYAQCVVYMNLTEMTRTLYLGVNKDTDDIYVERIHENKQDAEALLNRAEEIIMAMEPPKKMSPSKGYLTEAYDCRYCEAKSICQGSIEFALPIPFVSCRQCCHSTPTMDGNACWKCEKHKRGLSLEDQLRACEDHLILPGLITFAEPLGHGISSNREEFITFGDPNEQGHSWNHGKNGFTTKELMTLTPEVLVNKTINTIKSLFDATMTHHEKEDLLDEYPDDNVSGCIVWKGNVNGLIGEWKRRYKQDLETAKPIKKSKFFDHVCVEYYGNRLAVLYLQTKQAEIREREIPF